MNTLCMYWSSSKLQAPHYPLKGGMSKSQKKKAAAAKKKAAAVDAEISKAMEDTHISNNTTGKLHQHTGIQPPPIPQ